MALILTRQHQGIASGKVRLRSHPEATACGQRGIWYSGYVLLSSSSTWRSTRDALWSVPFYWGDGKQYIPYRSGVWLLLNGGKVFTYVLKGEASDSHLAHGFREWFAKPWGFAIPSMHPSLERLVPHFHIIPVARQV
jgi:hypothetical protein